jgi:hypothetical protein
MSAYVNEEWGSGGRISEDQKSHFSGDQKNDHEIKGLIFHEIKSFYSIFHNCSGD